MEEVDESAAGGLVASTVEQSGSVWFLKCPLLELTRYLQGNKLEKKLSSNKTPSTWNWAGGDKSVEGCQRLPGLFRTPARGGRSAGSPYPKFHCEHSGKTVGMTLEH